jgi:hypothetical protein
MRGHSWRRAPAPKFALALHDLPTCRSPAANDVFRCMNVHLLKPQFALRELFDEVVELAPDAREAKIASLDLPPAVGVRLRAMVVFDDLVELTPDQRHARLEALNLSEAVRARLEAMLVADTRAPALLKASQPKRSGTCATTPTKCSASPSSGPASAISACSN